MLKVLVLFILVPFLVFSQPNASFTYTTENNALCQGDTVYFQNTSSNYSYAHWFFGDGSDTWVDNPYHIYQSADNFDVTLIVYDDNGFSDTTSQTLTINPSPSVDLVNDAENSTLIARVQNADSVFWYFNGQLTGETDTIIYYFDEGLYTVEVKNNFGCLDSASVYISFGQGSTSASADSNSIVVRNNILTPDIQDGINDVLYIEGLAYFENPCIVQIYDRNGRLVYFNENYTNLGGFMGQDNNGRKLPAGTYFYIIKSEGKKTATGYIDLIR